MYFMYYKKYFELQFDEVLIKLILFIYYLKIKFTGFSYVQFSLKRGDYKKKKDTERKEKEACMWSSGTAAVCALQPKTCSALL